MFESNVYRCTEIAKVFFWGHKKEQQAREHEQKRSIQTIQVRNFFALNISSQDFPLESTNSCGKDPLNSCCQRSPFPNHILRGRYWISDMNGLIDQNFSTVQGAYSIRYLTISGRWNGSWRNFFSIFGIFIHFMKIIDGTTVICYKIDCITVVSNLIRPLPYKSLH